MEPECSLPHSQVPATCPYPAQRDPVHIATAHILKIHLNIVLPPTPGSPKWSHSLRFPHQNPLYASPLPHTSYMPPHLTLLDFINQKILDEECSSLSTLLCNIFHFLVTWPLLGPRYSPQQPILQRPQPTFLPQCEKPSFTPIQNNR